MDSKRLGAQYTMVLNVTNIIKKINLRSKMVIFFNKKPLNKCRYKAFATVLKHANHAPVRILPFTEAVCTSRLYAAPGVH